MAVWTAHKRQYKDAASDRENKIHLIAFIGAPAAPVVLVRIDKVSRPMVFARTGL
jgi:hypothetical protein